MTAGTGSILAVCALLLLASAGPAAAQTAPKAPAAPAIPSAPAAPAAPARALEPVTPPTIPVPEVAQRAEEVAAYLRSLDLLIVPSADIDAIQQKLPEMTARTDERVRETQAVLDSEPPLGTLDMLAESWQVRRLELSRWVELLTRYATRLEEELTRLKDSRETWTRARADARASQAPAPVIERIDGVLQSLQTARARVEGQRGVVLVLQDRVAREGARAEEALASIGQLRQGVAGRLFVRDPAAFGTTELDARAWSTVPGRVAESFAADFAQVRRFVSDGKGRFLVQLLVLVAIGLLLRAARERAKQWDEPDRGPFGVTRIFDRPWSAAVVFVLLESVWFHPRDPRAVRAIAEIIAFVPLVIVLRGLVGAYMLPWLHGLAAFFILDRVRQLVAVVPVLEQSLFVLEMGAAAVALTLALRSRRLRRGTAPRAESRGETLVWNVGRVMLGTFVFALVVGAIGYVALARLLGSGVLRSAYAALIIYTGLRIWDGLAAYALRSRPLALLRVVQRDRSGIQARLHRLFAGFTLIAVTISTLESFALLRPTVDAAHRLVGAKLSRGQVSLSLGDVGVFVITVAIAFALSSIVRWVLQEEVYPRLPLAPGLPYALSTVVHYLILLVGFLLAVAAVGVDLTKVTILAGAFGVGIGFGLQGVVNNFVSGLIVLFERPVRVGDDVQMGEVSGEVQRIGMRSSTVRTYEGADVIVPNAMLISERVTNWTLTDRMRRIDLAVGVAYGTPPEKVLDILREVARAHPRVVSDPAPLALFIGFGESALQFQLRVWTDRLERWLEVRSELGVALYAALRAAGMEIPVPQRDVRVTRPPR